MLLKHNYTHVYFINNNQTLEDYNNNNNKFLFSQFFMKFCFSKFIELIHSFTWGNIITTMPLGPPTTLEISILNVHGENVPAETAVAS